MTADELEQACLARLVHVVPAAAHDAAVAGVALATLAAADRVALAPSLGKLLARLATVEPFAPALPAVERDPREPVLPPCLVHGAFVPANILVRRAGRWRLAAVIDWRHARSGSPLEDLGSLLRELDTPAFRDGLARGYRAGRGVLPASWPAAARIADRRVQRQRSLC
ncbi:MAG: phosphotransferase family protein [Acidobacteriota bacterium]